MTMLTQKTNLLVYKMRKDFFSATIDKDERHALCSHTTFRKSDGTELSEKGFIVIIEVDEKGKNTGRLIIGIILKVKFIKINELPHMEYKKLIDLGVITDEGDPPFCYKIRYRINQIYNN